MSDSMSQACESGHCPAAIVNVGHADRILSLTGGGALVVASVFQPGWRGLFQLAGGAALLYRGFSGNCKVYQALGIDTATRHRPEGVSSQKGLRLERTIHIDRSPPELYMFWRNVENLPKVMRHLKSVTSTGGRRSHWVAAGPFNTTLEWDAEIISDQHYEMLAWQSLPGSQVDTAGSVHFKNAKSGSGTDLVISLKYDPPGGKWLAGVAEFLGCGLEAEIDADLREFKYFIEETEQKVI